MIIVKYGYIMVKKEQLENILALCNENSDKVNYIFNSNKDGKYINIYLTYEKEDRKYIVNLLKNYLRKDEQQYVINRQVDYIKFDCIKFY